MVYKWNEFAYVVGIPGRALDADDVERLREELGLSKTAFNALLTKNGEFTKQKAPRKDEVKDGD